MGWLLWRLWATMHLQCRMPLLGVSSNIFFGAVNPPIFSFRVEAEDPACVGIRCAAHSFQLLLKDLETTPLVRGSLAYMDTVLQTLEPPQMQDKLKELQKAAGKPQGKVPLKPVETRYKNTWIKVVRFRNRWSSKLHAMQVLVELKDFIQLLVPDVADTGMRFFSKNCSCSKNCS